MGTKATCDYRFTTTAYDRSLRDRSTSVMRERSKRAKCGQKPESKETSRTERLYYLGSFSFFPTAQGSGGPCVYLGESFGLGGLLLLVTQIKPVVIAAGTQL